MIKYVDEVTLEGVKWEKFPFKEENELTSKGYVVQCNDNFRYIILDENDEMNKTGIPDRIKGFQHFQFSFLSVPPGYILYVNCLTYKKSFSIGIPIV